MSISVLNASQYRLFNSDLTLESTHLLRGRSASPRPYTAMGATCSSAGPGDPLVKLNISGRPYAVLTRHFRPRSSKVSFAGDPPAEPNCLLETFVTSSHEERLQYCDCYLSTSNEYFFDRDIQIFEQVLHFCRTGVLHCPSDCCSQKFMDELDFWHLAPSKLAACCLDKMGQQERSRRSTVSSDIRNVNGLSTTIEFEEQRDEFGNACCAKMRRRIWDFMEEPGSSTPARFYSLASVLLVLLSVFTLMVASMPELQEKNPWTGQQDPIAPLRVIEIVCIIAFTIEYLVRLCVSPHKLDFIRTPLNIIDLLSVLPFYVELILQYADLYHTNLGKLKGALLMMRILRVLRVLRIFKLARYSGGLSSLGSTLQSSYREIGLLLMFMSITIVLYSTMVYYMEKDIEGTKFVSIPATFWWCIVTMTTVGYGDMVPESLGGKMVATLTSVSGVIVLAFPITLIVENFNRQYRKEMQTKGKHDGRRQSVGMPMIRTGFM